jgi:uncharacterized membrane protein YedE/YeeE
MSLTLTLLLVFIIGYLAQFIGLCMVRGVNEFKKGEPEFLLAILFSGVLSWVAMLFTSFVDIPSNFKTFEINIWVAIGGLLFGFGTAFNQGCGVSTLGKLTRGDSKMIFTIVGWLIGWTILANWNPSISHNKFIISPGITIVILIALSVALLVWAFIGDKERRRLWLTMMAIGLIGGFVFLFDPKWPPSGLLYKISNAIANTENSLWPLKESYFLFIALLTGMLSAAFYTKKFEIIKSTWKEWSLHLTAGTFMGIGASLALGGNDTQLLLALPVLSPAGAVAVLSMLVGIWSGLFVREKLIIKAELQNI